MLSRCERGNNYYNDDRLLDDRIRWNYVEISHLDCAIEYSHGSYNLFILRRRVYFFISDEKL